jgi:hypothetical protein
LHRVLEINSRLDFEVGSRVAPMRKAPVWVLLSVHDRHRITLQLRRGPVTPVNRCFVEDIIRYTLLERNTNPGVLPLWVGPEIEPLACVFRCQRTGFFHIFEVSEGAALDCFPTEGRA